MKIKYDKEVDVMNIQFSDAEIFETDEDKSGVIIDYDKDGNIVEIEILNASKHNYETNGKFSFENSDFVPVNLNNADPNLSTSILREDRDLR